MVAVKWQSEEQYGRKKPIKIPLYGSCGSELPMTMAEKTFLTTRLAA